MRSIFLNRLAGIAALVLFPMLLLCRASVAQPFASIDAWRSEAAWVRIVAENDLVQASGIVQRLERRLPSDATPGDRVRLLNLKGRIALYRAQSEDAAEFARQAMELARHHGDKVGQVEADLIVALNGVNQNRLEDVFEASDRALQTLEGVDRPDLLSEAMLRVGMSYRRKGQFDSSVTMAMEQMEIARRSGDPLALAQAHQGVAMAYDFSGRKEEAYGHFQHMLEQARRVPSKLLEAAAILELGNTDWALGRRQEAEKRIREAIAMFRAVGGPFYVCRANHTLADMLRRQGRAAEALLPLEESIAIYQRHGNKIGLWWALRLRSQTRQDLGRLADAQADAERTYALAKEIGLPLYLGESARLWGDLAAARGDYREAYRHLGEAHEMAQRVEREKAGARMIELAQRYDRDSEKRHIEELNRAAERQALRQRWLGTLLGSSLLLFAGAAFFLVRQRRANRVIHEANLQLHRSQEEIRALNNDLEQRVQERTAALRQQTRYVRTLLDTLPVSVWLKDAEGRYLVVNAGNRASAPYQDGEAGEEMVGKTDEELWPGDVGRSFRAFDREVMETRCRKTVEIAIPGKNGALLWREIDKAAVIDEDGTVIGTVGVARDITERKAMENSLRESRQMLTEAQRIAKVGSWEMNLVDNVLKWTDEIYRIFEIDPQQFGASYEAFMNAVHPDDRELVDSTYKASLEKHERFEIEHRLLLPDGRIKYVFECCENYYDENGKALRSLGTVHDITERIFAEQYERFRSRALELLAGGGSLAEVLGEVVCGVEHFVPGGIGSILLLDSQGKHLTNGAAPSLPAFYNAAIEGMEIGKGAGSCGMAAASGERFIVEDIATHPEWVPYREIATRAGVRACWSQPIFSSSGRVLGTFAIYHRERYAPSVADIALVENAAHLVSVAIERKRAEQELRQALEFTEGIIDAIPDLLFEMDRDGRYLNIWAHDPRLLATQREVLLGKTVREALDPEAAEVSLSAIAEADATGHSFGKTIRLDLPHGASWFEVSVAKKAAGGLADDRFIVLSRDITERVRMQDELNKREQELRALAESSPGMMGSFYQRPDGRVCMPYVSPNIRELFGLTPEEVAADATPLLALTHPDDAAMVRDTIAASARTLTTWHAEYRILHPSKGERWMEGNTNPQPHPEGGVIWYGYIHDITARKRMEAAQKESEARYRYHFNLIQSMLEGSPSLSFYAFDREYRLLAFNRKFRDAAKRLWGADIAIGMSMLEVIDTEAHREFFRQGADQVLAGRSYSLDSEEVVVRDGVTTHEYHENYGSPIRNDDGEIIGVTVFVITVTERKRLEAELRDSRNFLDRVIDAVSDPIFVKDRQHRWILLNDANCRFTGLPREALIGKTDYDVFPREQADVFWEKDELVFESGEVNLNEEKFTSANGDEHYIQTKKTPFVSADGQLMLVGVIRDISELKRYEAAREAALAEAQRLARLRSEFIAHVSHELRTPLNGILGYAQILQRDKALCEQNAAALNVIHQSGEHLLALVEDLLDLARIEAGRFQLDSGDISLARFLHGVADIVSIRARQKGVAFSCEPAGDLPKCVRGDEKRLRQVLLNLLSNAVKFTERGKVVLRVARSGASRLIFTVEDTGMGIAASELETIFLPFEQSGDAQQRRGGTGLGLSISRQIVRLMGGDIAVESGVGIGSTFRFELELPEVGLAGAALGAVSGDVSDAPLGLTETGEPPETLIAPPPEQMRDLHRLAQLGNMRDIVQYADYLAGLDPCYFPFISRLRRLAENYQSKAILAFVEEYLP